MQMSENTIAIDADSNLPSPYITFNPEMLDDETWTYRDLQKLSMKLGLGGKGGREQLVEKLKQWHKQQFNEERHGPGSNFALLEVEVPACLLQPDATPASPSKGAAPSLLSPLKINPAKKTQEGLPIGILSPSKRNTPSAQKKRLSFSIFNGTKIIPDRIAARQAMRFSEENEVNIDKFIFSIVLLMDKSNLFKSM
jgi:hypothetical protein